LVQLPLSTPFWGDLCCLWIGDEQSQSKRNGGCLIIRVKAHGEEVYTGGGLASVLGEEEEWGPRAAELASWAKGTIARKLRLEPRSCTTEAEGQGTGGLEVKGSYWRLPGIGGSQGKVQPRIRAVGARERGAWAGIVTEPLQEQPPLDTGLPETHGRFRYTESKEERNIASDHLFVKFFKNLQYWDGTQGLQLGAY
jgi:hypothetical protein